MSNMVIPYYDEAQGKAMILDEAPFTDEGCPKDYGTLTLQHLRILNVSMYTL